MPVLTLAPEAKALIEKVQQAWESLREAKDVIDVKSEANQLTTQVSEEDRRETGVSSRYSHVASCILDHYVFDVPKQLEGILGKYDDTGLWVHQKVKLKITATGELIEEMKYLKKLGKYLDSKNKMPYITSPILYEKMKWIEWLLAHLKQIKEQLGIPSLFKRWVESSIDSRLTASTERLDQYEKENNILPRLPVDERWGDFEKKRAETQQREEENRLKEKLEKEEADRKEWAEEAANQRDLLDMVVEELPNQPMASENPVTALPAQPVLIPSPAFVAAAPEKPVPQLSTSFSMAAFYHQHKRTMALMFAGGLVFAGYFIASVFFPPLGVLGVAFLLHKIGLALTACVFSAAGLLSGLGVAKLVEQCLKCFKKKKPTVKQVAERKEAEFVWGEVGSENSGDKLKRKLKQSRVLSPFLKRKGEQPVDPCYGNTFPEAKTDGSLRKLKFKLNQILPASIKKEEPLESRAPSMDMSNF